MSEDNGSEGNGKQEGYELSPEEAILNARHAEAGAKAVYPVVVKTMIDLRVHTDAFVKLLRTYAANLGE